MQKGLRLLLALLELGWGRALFEQDGYSPNWLLGRALGISRASVEATMGKMGLRRRDSVSVTHLYLFHVLELCVKCCFHIGFGGQKPI